MYPAGRLVYEILAHGKRGDDLFAVHVSNHRCWPWDADFAGELNNGRALTLMDLGRIPLVIRTGLWDTALKQKWRMTMGGVIVRYRRRIRPFERFEMKSHVLGWDNRFTYVEQSTWKKTGDCAHHAVYRVAVADDGGIVAPDRLMAAMGHPDPSPALPDWIAKWSEAESLRPWPPMQD